MTIRYVTLALDHITKINDSIVGCLKL